MAITQAITALPTAPDPATMTPAEFSTAAATYVLAMKAMEPELNTWADQVNAIVATAVGDVATAIGAAAADTPVDADEFAWRKTSTGLLKKITLANLKGVFAAIKVGAFTRDVSAASGSVAYTGVGFSPRALLFSFSRPGSTSVGWGYATPSNVGNTACYGANVWITDSTYCMRAYTDAANAQAAAVASWDSDGFTLTWTKTGTLSGIIDVTYFAIG